MFQVRQAVGEQDQQAVKTLFIKYAESLPFELDFQNFDQELENFPGIYSSPQGRLLLATHSEQVAGCVALKPLDSDVCEMKRLYVFPEFRGQAVGKQLALAVIEAARTIGYHSMKLDTVASMKAALGLYEALGFRPTEPYTFNPLDDAVFLELALT